MGHQLIKVHAYQGCADVLVGVAEQEFVADLFDCELDGVADQQLVTSFDREIFDSVASLGEFEHIGTSTTDQGVITFASIEAVFVIPTFETIAAMASEQGVTPFPTFDHIIAMFSTKSITTSFSMQEVIGLLSNKYVAAT